MKFEPAEEKERAGEVAREHANALDAKSRRWRPSAAQAEAVRTPSVERQSADVDAQFVETSTLIEANKIIAAEDLQAATDASEKRFSAVEAAAAADKAAAAEALQAHESTVAERFSGVDERFTAETAARQADALAAKEALDTQLATMEEERVKRDEAFAAAQAEEKARRAEADAAFKTEVESSIAEVDERRQRDVKSAQDLRTADLATIEQRNAQVDAALEAAQADTDDKFAKAEASQLEDKVELLEAAAQRRQGRGRKIFGAQRR